MDGTCSTHGRDVKYIQNFGRKTWRKLPLGRLWRRWKDNTRTDLKEIVWEDVDWIHPVDDTDQWQELLETVMNFRVP